MSTVKLTFFSAYNRPPSKAEKRCPKEFQDYEAEKGTHNLIPTKKIEFYKEIQSYYESTRIDVKIKRYSMGDFSALGVDGGAYGDFSNIPTNLATVLNAKETAKQGFFGLPAEVRELFNNDFSAFIGSIEDGTYEQRLIEYARGKSTGTGTEPGTGTGTEPGTSTSATNNGGNN